MRQHSAFKNIYDELEGKEELETAGLYSLFQIGKLVWIGMLAAGIFLIEFIFPDFFNYPFFTRSIHLDDVLRFWPMYAWGVGVSALLMLIGHAKNRSITSSKYDGHILGAKLLTSTLAGVWEELAFRWASIPYAMGGIMLMNFFWSIGVGYFCGAVALVMILKCAFDDDLSWIGKFGGVVFFAILAYGSFKFAHTVDPFYWVLREIIVPVADFMTHRELHHLIAGEHATLFVLAFITVNSAFRDGHKYQGPIGWVNSWYMGMILIYATMTYGLLTAIAVHALYDIFITLLQYVLRKIFG